MSEEVKTSWSRGKLVSAIESRPLIEVEWEEWATDVPPEQLPHGKLVSAIESRPLIAAEWEIPAGSAEVREIPPHHRGFDVCEGMSVLELLEVVNECLSRQESGDSGRRQNLTQVRNQLVGVLSKDPHAALYLGSQLLSGTV